MNTLLAYGASRLSDLGRFVTSTEHVAQKNNLFKLNNRQVLVTNVVAVPIMGIALANGLIEAQDKMAYNVAVALGAKPTDEVFDTTNVVTGFIGGLVSSLVCFGLPTIAIALAVKKLV